MVRTHFKSDKPQRTSKKARGYALHDRRIAFGEEHRIAHPAEVKGDIKAIRTIKYPISAEDCASDYNQLAADIESDVFHLYGPTSYSSWSRTLLEETPSYSFLDLWLDALSLGGVFQENASDIWRLGRAVVGDDPIPRFVEQVTPKLKSKYSEQVNLGALYLFCTTDQRPKEGSSPCAVVFDDKKSPTAKELIRSLEAQFAPLHATLRESKVSKQEKALKKLQLFADLEESDLNDIFADNNETDTLPVESASTDLSLTFLIVPSLHTHILPELNGLWRISRGERVHQIIQGIAGGNKNLLFGTGIKTEILLGLGKNALSHFGGKFLEALRQPDGPDLLARLMVQRLGNQSFFYGEVKSRLVLLRDRALHLPVRPMLQSSWGDFRHDVLGKLSSWYSNQANYASNIFDKLEGTKREIARRSDLLNSTTKELKNDRLKTLVQSAKEFASEALRRTECGESFFSGEFRAIYDQLLLAVADLNTGWNQYEQSLGEMSGPLSNKGKKRRNKGEEENEGSRTPRISLPKFPAFFGDEMRLRFARFRESPTLLALLLSVFDKSLAAVEAPPLEKLSQDEVAKICQRLLGSFRRLVSHVSPIRPAILKEARLDCFKSVRLTEGFYANPRARKKLTVLPTPSLSVITASFSSLTEFTSQVLRDGLIHNELADPQMLRVAIQTSSTLLAIGRDTAGLSSVLLDGIERCATKELSSSNESAFPRLRGLWEVVSSSSRQIENLDKLLSVVCAEASGLVSLCSRRIILERYAVQAINGQQTNIYASERNGISRFAVGFPKWNHSMTSKISEEYPTLFLQAQETVRKVIKSKGNTIAQFRIQSSIHQLQFLRWAWKQPRSKKCSLEMGGGFLIAEAPISLKIQDGSLVPEKLPNPRIFISQPFEMKPLEGVASGNKQNSSQRGFIENRLMGVDVGEYGLAFSVVQKSVEPDGLIRLNLLDSGVLLSGTHRVLRDKVHKLKRRQRTGVFSASDSSIAGARESLIGSYTNRLHALALRHRARLVFEFNISVFEAGGNRIKTVYDTIKRADVPPRGDAAAADKSRQKHVWGSESLGTGKEVGASGTSQTCAKCCRWFLDDLDGLKDEELKELFKSARVLSPDGHYHAHEIELPGGTLRFFVDHSARDSIAKMDLDGLKRAIKAYIRPPLWRLGKNILPRNAKIRRGNSSAYRCPYADCGHISDADVQAAFNVAARAFLKADKFLEGESRWTKVYKTKVKKTDPPILDRRYFGPHGR